MYMLRVQFLADEVNEVSLKISSIKLPFLANLMLFVNCQSFQLLDLKDFSSLFSLQPRSFFLLESLLHTLYCKYILVTPLYRSW